MSTVCLPMRQGLHAAVARLIALAGSEYVGWRQRIRHALGRRRLSEHEFIHNAEEFQPFLAVYATLELKHGSDVAFPKMDAVIRSVTAERRRHYDAQYRNCQRTAEEVSYIPERNRNYMRAYRNQRGNDD